MALDHPGPSQAVEEVPGPDGYYGLARTEMLELLPSGIESLLDVGCGDGAFLDACRQRLPNLRLSGIEPAKGPASRGRARGLDVTTGSFPDDLPPSKRFDCIVLNDVLEHLVDPWTALQTAGERLSDEGWVVASIPNIRNLETIFDLVRHGTWDYVDAGVLDRTHLRFFTRSTILTLFEGAGYDVVTIRGGLQIESRKLRALRFLSIAAGRTLYRDGCFRQFHLVARRAPGAHPTPKR